MVAALAAADAGANALVLEKQALIGGSTCMSGGIVVGPEQPGDAGRRRPRLVRGRHGALRGRRRRRRAVLVVRAPPRLPHGRARDGHVPAASGASASSTAPATATTTRTSRAAHDVGPRDRASPLRRPARSATGSTSCNPAWRKSLGLAVMTNEARSLSHYNRSVRAFAVVGPGRAAHVRGRARRQALLTNGASLDRPDARGRSRARVPVWTEAPLEDLIVEDGRVVGVRTMRTARRSRPSPHGVLLAAGRIRPQPRDAPAVRRRPAERGQVVDRQPRRHRRGARRRRCGSARRPT